MIVAFVFFGYCMIIYGVVMFFKAISYYKKSKKQEEEILKNNKEFSEYLEHKENVKKLF